MSLKKCLHYPPLSFFKAMSENIIWLVQYSPHITVRWSGVEGVSQCLLISLMQAFNNQKMRGRKSCLRLKQFRNITWRQASNFLLVHNCLERFRMTEVGALCRQFVRPAYCIFFLICDKNIVFARVCNFAKKSFLEERKPLLFKIGWKKLVFRPNQSLKKWSCDTDRSHYIQTVQIFR